MSVAKTDGSSPGMCIDCGCLVEQGWERTHEEWHQKLRNYVTELDRAIQFILSILEGKGTP